MNRNEKENNRRCFTPVVIKGNKTNERTVLTSHEINSDELNLAKISRYDCVTPCTLHADLEVFSILQNTLPSESLDNSDSEEVVERTHRPGLM